MNIPKDVLNDIKVIRDNLDETDNTKAYRIDNALDSVEESLLSFIAKRFKKIEEDVEFESHIKQAILNRLSEFSPALLTSLLDAVQVNNNNSSNAMLLPVLQENTNKLGIADREQKERDTKLNGDVLQGLQDINKFIQLFENAKQGKNE